MTYEPIPGSDDLYWDPNGFVVETPTCAQINGLSTYHSIANTRTRILRWDDILLTRQEDTLDPFAGLKMDSTMKQLVRDGIPDKYRRAAWLRFSGAEAKMRRNPGYYQHLVVENHDRKDATVEQIELDLMRTFQNHKRQSERRMAERLRRVLVAYAMKNEALGYTQSLNYFAFFLCLFLTEEESFWVLSTIVEDILPSDYYEKSLASVLIDQRVLEALVAWKVGQDLVDHMAESGFPLRMMTTDWFMCLFTKSLSSDCALRVIDTVLYEGDKALFRYGIAVMRLLKKPLLQAQTLGDISHVLSNLQLYITDPDVLAANAFAHSKIGSFPRARIAELRRIYRAEVLHELDTAAERRRHITDYAPIPPSPRLDVDSDLGEAPDELLVYPSLLDELESVEPDESDKDQDAHSRGERVKQHKEAIELESKWLYSGISFEEKPTSVRLNLPSNPSP